MELRMASGKKNYFRHSFNAFDDDKIQTAIDKLGYAGYAYYFILLEVLAKQCETEVKNPIKIHQQTLRNVWRKHTKSCKKVVEKLEESGLFYATFTDSFIEFDIPNLSKYLGKYSDKKPPKGPNKRKEKEIKENEIKEKPDVPVLKIQTTEIITYFNLITGKNYKTDDFEAVRVIILLLKQDYQVKDFKHVVDVKNEDWKDRPEMDSSMRPITFFAEDKFSSYLNQKLIKEPEYDFSIFK